MVKDLKKDKKFKIIVKRLLNTPPKPKTTKKKKSGGSPPRLEAKLVTAVSKPKKVKKTKKKSKGKSKLRRRLPTGNDNIVAPVQLFDEADALFGKRTNIPSKVKK